MMGLGGGGALAESAAFNWCPKLLFMKCIYEFYEAGVIFIFPEVSVKDVYVCGALPLCSVNVMLVS